MTHNLFQSSQYIWNRKGLTRHIGVVMKQVMVIQVVGDRLRVTGET
jgi:hypothetical protein